jgi:hypothetical protein
MPSPYKWGRGKRERETGRGGFKCAINTSSPIFSFLMYIITLITLQYKTSAVYNALLNNPWPFS